jgi:hypothetical protein
MRRTHLEADISSLRRDRAPLWGIIAIHKKIGRPIDSNCQGSSKDGFKSETSFRE